MQTTTLSIDDVDIPMTLTGDAPAIRRAKSMRSRVEEVSDDIAIQESDDHCDALSALVRDCASLSEQWRAVIRHISQQLKCGQEIDLRTVGDILKPTAARTRLIYEKVQEWIGRSTCQIPESDKIDLHLAIREVNAWGEWLSNLPTWDSTRRDQARQELASGSLCTREDEDAIFASV